MARRRRRRSRRGNPEYSDAVYELVNEFIDALATTANLGEKIARKIDIKAGRTRIGAEIEKIAEKLQDLGHGLEDGLGD